MLLQQDQTKQTSYAKRDTSNNTKFNWTEIFTQPLKNN